MYFMRMIFVKRNWTSDKEKIEKTFSQINKLNNNFWIISYLEGSRITPDKIKDVCIDLIIISLKILYIIYILLIINY